MLIQHCGDTPSCNEAEKLNYGLKWKMIRDEEWRKAGVVTPGNHAFRIKALAPKILKFATGAYEPPLVDEYLDSLNMTLLC